MMLDARDKYPLPGHIADKLDGTEPIMILLTVEQIRSIDMSDVEGAAEWQSGTPEARLCIHRCQGDADGMAFIANFFELEAKNFFDSNPETSKPFRDMHGIGDFWTGLCPVDLDRFVETLGYVEDREYIPEAFNFAPPNFAPDGECDTYLLSDAKTLFEEYVGNMKALFAIAESELARLQK